MAGFYELATGLQAPILGILRARQPIISGGHLKNSRFWVIAAGDRVRSALAEAALLRRAIRAPARQNVMKILPQRMKGRVNLIRSEAVQRNRSVDMMQRDLPLSS
jgi:hypothetical protein